MAIIIACDGGCGAQSPDAQGAHVAMTWITVSGRPALRGAGATGLCDYILCQDCWASSTRRSAARRRSRADG